MFFSIRIVSVLFIMHFIIGAIAKTVIPYYSRFAYNEALSLPRFITNLANFDGVHYIHIAQRRYVNPGEFAFFPLYSVLIRLVSFVFRDFVLSALGISIVCFILALFVLRRYLRLIEKRPFVRTWFWILFLTFPTSFFFHAAYTESLFLLLFVSVLYFLRTKQYAIVFICALLAGLTKIMGVFVCIPIVVHFAPQIYTSIQKRNWRKLISPLLLCTASFFGMGIYMLYLHLTAQDALRFIHVMSTYGEQRSGLFIMFPQVVYRYIKILLTAQFNLQYGIASIELVIFLFFFCILCYEALKVIRNKINRPIFFELGIFSLVNLLLPTVSGSFSSIPRYVLMSLYVFIVLSRVQNRYIKGTLAFIFCILHIIFFAFYSQGYFVG